MKKSNRVQKDKLMWQVIAASADRFDSVYDLAVAYIEGASAYYVANYVNAKRKVAFVHIDYQAAGYNRALDKDAFLQFEHIFCVSEKGVDSFCEVYPEKKDKTTLFRNPINGDVIKLEALHSGSKISADNRLHFVTVARLHYQKGLDIAIEAAAILRDRGLDFKWHILGDGALIDELNAQIAEKKLSQIFILEGALENPYPTVRDADLYIQPSRFEGRSVAIQEASVLGKPIIATNCSGNIEQLTHGEDGFFCEISASALADAIENVIKDETLRMRIAANAAAKPYVYIEDVDLLKSFGEINE